MNKAILALLILGIFIAGCGNQAVDTQQDNDISRDLDEIDQLDKDLDIQGLEDLEKDLKDVENI